MKFVNSQSGIDAIFVTKDNKIYLTNEVKNIFKLTNSDFTIAN